MSGAPALAPLAEAEAEAATDGLPLYARYFGLKRAPFSIAPDPRYLYMSDRHREALAHLLYGLKGGGGFVLLTGEVGAGKTTICRCMLDQVPPRCNVAYIFNPKLTVAELLQTVCDEFHIPRALTGPTIKDHVDALNLYLLRTHAVGQTNVLVIDEAQNLSPDVLEQLRLLTNLETNERKLLQIVLVGQPELRSMLAAPGLEQLAQRVIARYHLKALSATDVRQYIRHRLKVAGLRGPLPFDREALRRVMFHSRGVARRINLLCDRAMLGAYAEGKPHISQRIVDKAAIEALDAAAPQRKPRWRPWAAGIGIVLALGAAVWAGWSARDAQRKPPEAASAKPLAPSPALRPAPPRPEQAAIVKPASDIRPVSVWLRAEDLQARFGTDPDEATAWRQLGAVWGLVLSDAEPCRAALRAGLHCFRDTASNLSMIRQLGRPGLLTLHDGQGNSTRAMLIGLSSQTATLRAFNGGEHTVALASLAPLWRGEFATLWRAPPGFKPGAFDVEPGPAADDVAARLTLLAQQAPQLAGQPQDSSLRNAIAAFQLVQGLKPDGKAGPVTLMHLNPLTGVAEPRLKLER
ncbi:AAA family ATPase [Niveibacterium sp. 24ML]|uniref:AAA family ATPase n=1 Tax=Niveibacterium sp. 24ML TaxID=2985512 RepID=UPI00226EC77C|nr:AAA family ATPase [Niveibacterium sp. 24ML]MCX9156298.1 AAA family ATPase [Niveibacterium sp. 24ML]